MSGAAQAGVAEGEEEIGGHATHRERGRGRPTNQEIVLKLMHDNEDLKKENAELRARMADHFFALSVPYGGA